VHAPHPTCTLPEAHTRTPLCVTGVGVEMTTSPTRLSPAWNTRSLRLSTTCTSMQLTHTEHCERLARFAAAAPRRLRTAFG
jgi:hypothetical protein